MTTWIDEAFKDHNATACAHCDDGYYEATVYWWGLDVTCPDCGDSYTVEPPGPNPAAARH